MTRTCHSLLIFCLAAALACAGLVGAGSQAASADTGEVRAITFPVGGPVHFIDDFGAPRVGHTHMGNDIMAGKLQPEFAAHDGWVSWMRLEGAGYPNNGNLLILRDDEGWEYWYIHINNDTPGTDDQTNPDEWNIRPGVKVGKRVFAGEQIAYVGDSGDAETTASHLHFEIHKPDGTVISPYSSLMAASHAPIDPALVSANTPYGHLDAVSTAAGGVSMSGWAIDPNVSGPDTVTVFDNGFRLTDLTADTSRPDVGAAFPTAGAAHGFDDRLPLGDGTHNLCAYAINDGAGGSPLIGCGSVTVVGSPIGMLDIAGRDPAGMRVAGWSIDPDAAGPVSIRMTVDSAAPTTVVADGSRPDVGAAFPDAGPNHGFDATFAVPTGTHRICVTALNRAAGADKTLGCINVLVTSNPIGNLDMANPTRGGFDIGGWAIDPDTSDPIGVDIVLDGVTVSTLWTATSRPDVNAAFPGYPGNHGFAATIPAGPGSHYVCARGRNVGAGVTTTIACRAAVVTGLPFGNLDVANRSGSTVNVAGWAIDPDTVGPIDVHYYVDGAFGGAVRSDQPRGDVGAVFPAYGSSHGYSFSVPLSAGPHQICVYAINVGTPDVNPLIACAVS